MIGSTTHCPLLNVNRGITQFCELLIAIAIRDFGATMTHKKSRHRGFGSIIIDRCECGVHLPQIIPLLPYYYILYYYLLTMMCVCCCEWSVRIVLNYNNILTEITEIRRISIVISRCSCVRSLFGHLCHCVECICGNIGILVCDIISMAEVRREMRTLRR